MFSTDFEDTNHTISSIMNFTPIKSLPIKNYFFLLADNQDAQWSRTKKKLSKLL